MSLSLNEWLSLLESRHPKTIDLGLERCHEVWQRMGSPQPARQIITVAGTNGKGSTVAYLGGMLRALAYSYGSYTTPHLLCYNERVQLDGRVVTDQQLIEAFERVEAARTNVSLSYFEFGTLAAISIMNHAGKIAGNEDALDFAIMEVGLGGRLDAVNILDTNCAVITTVGLDHQEYLGDDRESIGWEKAGIIRRKTPLVCGETDPPASVMEAAALLGAPVLRLGHDFGADNSGSSVRFTKGRKAFLVPRPRMAGRHQVNNLATAVAALLELVPDAAEDIGLLSDGVTSVSLSGRLQQVSEQPRVYVDVGHNALAAEAIVDVLGQIGQADEEVNCHCVIGMLADKDAAAIAQIFNPVVGRWYCAGLEGDRGQSGEQLAARIRARAVNANVVTCTDVESALDAALGALNKECPSSDYLLVFGSFLTAGQAIRYFAPQTELDADRIPP